MSSSPPEDMHKIGQWNTEKLILTEVAEGVLELVNQLDEILIHGGGFGARGGREERVVVKIPGSSRVETETAGLFTFINFGRSSRGFGLTLIPTQARNTLNAQYGFPHGRNGALRSLSQRAIGKNCKEKVHARALSVEDLEIQRTSNCKISNTSSPPVTQNLGRARSAPLVWVNIDLIK